MGIDFMFEMDDHYRFKRNFMDETLIANIKTTRLDTFF